MTRDDVIARLKNYFSVRELVCDHTYAKWGEQSWQFLDTAYLHTLLVIRESILKKPMTCNGGQSFQRGLRCNMCPMVKGKTSVYLSAHILGKAGDFTVKDMSAEEARRAIVANQALLPYPIRVESDVTWLHVDTLDQYNVTAKVYLFKG